jgi:hypothetical protein
MKRLLILFALLVPWAAEASLGTDSSSKNMSESTQKVIRALGEARGYPLSDAEISMISKDYEQTLSRTRVASRARNVTDAEVHVLACVGAEAGAELSLGLDMSAYVCAEWGHMYVLGMGGALGAGAGVTVQAGVVVVQAQRGEAITGTYSGGRAGAAFKLGLAGAYMTKDINPDDQYVLQEDLDENRWLVAGLVQAGYQANMVEAQAELMNLEFKFELKLW